ncbi:MAG: DUF1552 domain-containing protein [Pirellulales bacterium]
MRNRFPLSRRTFLRGTGVSLALPWLEGMLPRASASAAVADAAPVRMAVLFMPNGVPPKKWSPSGVGREFELSSILEPLKDFKNDIVIPTNLWHQASNTGDGHYVKTAGLLTGTTINKTVGLDLNCNGVSLDQVAAQAIGRQTPLPSLELGTDPVDLGVDAQVGYTRVYGGHISWSGPTRPVAKEIHPRLVYERLFRAAQPHDAAATSDKPLLDLVLGDAKRLRAQLGGHDRQKIDEYLESVRALEQRLDRTTSSDRQAWKPRAAVEHAGTLPAAIPESHQEHVQLMLDMIVLAFRADVTRVSTFMFGNSVSGTDFSFLDGVKGGHHPLSHHQNEESNLKQYELIARWHIAQYAYLLTKLREVREGERSLLENTMVMFGSDLHDGNRHSPHNLPIVLAGQAGGRLQTGQHLEFSADTPLANLYVSMLTAMGVPTKRFADSTGPLPGVLA